jgi:hypothetical protein
MQCPNHKDQWLYPNVAETHGYCPRCREWYKLIKNTIMQDSQIKKQRDEGQKVLF